MIVMLMKIKFWWTLTLIALAAVLTHASYFDNGFVWFDHVQLENRATVFPVSQIYKAFSTRYAGTGFYRPVVNMADSVDGALYHRWPPGYHITNIIIYLAGIAAAFVFFGAFFGLSRKESAVA